MGIEVTQKDIDKGIQENCYACPIALAGHRYPAPFKIERVQVGYRKIYLISEGLDKWLTAALPDEAQKFAKDFDCGRRVKPFVIDNLDWEIGIRP